MNAKQPAIDQFIKENHDQRARIALLEAALQVRQREIHTLHRISEIALREQPLSAALSEVVQEVSACTGFPIVAIELYDEARQLMQIVAATGMPMSAAGRSIPADQTLSGLVARSGQALVEACAQDRPEYADAELRRLGVQTFVCVPMRVAGQVIGTIALAHPDLLGPLDAQIVPLAHSLANSTAALIARKRAESTSYRLAERLELATRAAHIGVWDWDIQQNELVWDDRMYEIYGVRREDFAGAYAAWLKGLHPDDRAPSDAISAQARRGECAYDTEFRVVWPDGSIHVLKAAGDVIRGADGTPLRMIGVTYDITEHKRAEVDLQVTLAKYQTLFDMFPLGITVSDATGQIIETNATAERLLGVGREEHKRRQIDGAEWQIVRPDGSPMPADEYASVRALREQRIIENVEMGVPSGAGVTTWINVTAAPLPPEHQRVVITYGDITARKQAEAALRESRQNLESLIENTDGSIWSVDTQYRLIVGNRLYHHNVSAAIGRGLVPGECVLVPELPQAALAEWQGYYDRAMCSGPFSVEAGTRFTAEPHTVEYRLSPITTATGQVVGATIFGRDITERKLAEEELRRSNADLEQFAYVASHDLQEPLRAVTGMVQLLQQRYQGRLDEHADQYINLAVEAAARMQALINGLLAFSHLQRRGKPLTPTAAEAVLADALANLQVACAESAAVITHDALPTVPADPTQLTQLFQNLISNAIKFRDQAPPRIHVGAARRDGDWCFSVRDNGIGIAPDYFERIFAIFQRLHPRRAYPGTGIGLALCKKIVERHGGQIWVESQPGQGATFCFTIPDRS